MIGADTSFLIDFLKGEPHAVTWMRENQEYLCLNELVVYEFCCGRLTSRQLDQFLAFALQFPVFSLDRNASMKASELFRGAKMKGRSIAHPDALIAGTYLANNISRIITRNEKHFEHLPLQTIKY